MAWLSADAPMAQTRGVVLLHDPAGRTVGLYAESHALLIGVSAYQGAWDELTSIPRELERLKRALGQQGFEVEVKLNPKNAREFKDWVERFIYAHGLNPDNRLLFFFAGHGYTRKDGQKGYLVMSETPHPEEDDDPAFVSSALDLGIFQYWAEDLIESKHALFLFDSCFSGTVFETFRGREPVPEMITELTAEPIRQFITAGKANETVPARSVFAPAFADAIEYGRADRSPRDGYVTGMELFLYLREVVPKYAKARGTVQTPRLGGVPDFDLNRGDFVFVLPEAPPPPATARLTVRSEETAERSKPALESDTRILGGTIGQPWTSSWPPPTAGDGWRFFTDETGLVWTRRDNERDISWEEAEKYCKNLPSVTGYEVWRLPSLSELKTLYDRNSVEQYKIRRPLELTGCYVWAATEANRQWSNARFHFDTGKEDPGYLPLSPNCETRALCVTRRSIRNQR